MRTVRRPTHRQVIPLEVRRSARISPSFVQLTLGGPDLAHLERAGFDHTVRLFFPREGQDTVALPTVSGNGWMVQVMLWPKVRRPWVRTYTVRRFRPAEQEIDIEFVLHAGSSPASAWASNARPGDPAGILDEGMTYLPRRRASGPQVRRHVRRPLAAGSLQSGLSLSDVPR